MAYGFQLKKTSDNTVYDQNISFYTSPRGGISTSDSYYFETLHFNTSLMYLSFDNLANYLPSLNIYQASTNLDITGQNLFPVVRNLSKPTVVKICDVAGFEISAGNKIFSSLGLNIGSQILLNYSSPQYLQTITQISPLTLSSSSKMNQIINSNYIQKDNFAYVRFVDNNFYKYFLLVYINSVWSWYEIPDDKFYNSVDFYLNNSDQTFDGTKINYASFNNIPVNAGQQILINNPINAEHKTIIATFFATFIVS
jgi:hypothetical protein